MCVLCNCQRRVLSLAVVVILHRCFVWRASGTGNALRTAKAFWCSCGGLLKEHAFLVLAESGAVWVICVCYRASCKCDQACMDGGTRTDHLLQ